MVVRVTKGNGNVCGVKTTQKQPSTPVNYAKGVWIICNLLFILNYTLGLLGLFVKTVCLGNRWNCLLLSIVFVASILQNVKNGGDLINNRNTLSVMFFLSFPRGIFLLPYYILSIYHVIGNYHKELKETENKTPAQQGLFMAVSSIQHHCRMFGTASVVLTFCNCILALFMFELHTFFFLLLIVRQQFHENEAMTNLIYWLVDLMDNHIHKAPSVLQQLYTKIKKMSKNKKINPEAKNK
ncbi:hypothetical protein ECANGB1_2252 [Enterospora canceri]|uniref:Uncharacterized protein n=1 Tax=Enterospora canceri TaxID=1081671 RepID=A0A1Y1S4W7_9MICR|nr:hypothetical protein ECANGB1_2252 [Enterospora canceri]